MSLEKPCLNMQHALVCAARRAPEKACHALMRRLATVAAAVHPREPLASTASLPSRHTYRALSNVTSTAVKGDSSTASLSAAVLKVRSATPADTRCMQMAVTAELATSFDLHSDAYQSPAVPCSQKRCCRASHGIPYAP